VDIVIREYQEKDRELLQLLIEKLMDCVVTTDLIKRIRRMEGFGDIQTEKVLKKIKENNGKIFFAEMDGVVIGYISGFSKKQSKENLLEVIPTKLGVIDDLYIGGEHRGKHVGTTLMQKMEEYFKSVDCDSIWIEVFVPNKIAHDYYKKLGFMDREVGMLKKLD
jgi:ribosomal protein S18 acetylase RimI-like enzyme